MSISSFSFETRSGRFVGGANILINSEYYSPSNQLISKTALAAFKLDVKAKDDAVLVAQVNLDNSREERRLLAFKSGDENPTCIQNLIKLITNYCEVELASQKGVNKRLKVIMSHIEPVYKKAPKVPSAPGTGATTQSQKPPQPISERTYAALHGYGAEVAKIIDQFGLSYNPINEDIQLASFTTKINSLETLNFQVPSLEGIYSDAVKARKEVYDGLNGMSDRIRLIKKYLSSNTGAKESSLYVNFDRAIKGL